MTTQKRFVAVLLTILMMMQMLPLNALAEAAWKLGGEASVEGAAYHSVTFTSEDKQIAKQLFENGSPIVTMPEDPAKAGYRFVGWFDGEQEISEGTVVQADINAVAKFEPIVTYTVTIQYLANEKPVADEVVRQYTADDPADTILSPASVSDGAEGFLYPDQTSVTVTPSELEEENTIIEVHYVAANAEYTVRHMAKNLADEGYTEIESEQHHGVIGAFVVPEPKEYAYYDFERAEGKTLETAGTVIEVYYTRKPFVLNYDSQGGSYIAPKTGLYEEQVDVYTKTQGEGILSCGLEEHMHTEVPSRNGFYDGEESECWTWKKSGRRGQWVLSCGKVEHTHSNSCYSAGPVSWDPAPTRTGYTFVGWYLDADCTQPADETIQLKDNATVYAKWDAAEANYTIVYFKQIWDNNTGSPYYAYADTAIGKGTVGTTVTGRDNQKYSHYQYARSTSEVIKPDGSTVVSVYYDLIKYTIIFDLNDSKNVTGTIKIGGKTYGSNEYRLKDVVLGQDISALWPTTDNTSRSNGQKLDTWNGNYKTKRFEITSDMLSGADKNHQVTYEAAWTNTNNVKKVNYWLQKADGSGYEKSEVYSQSFIQDSYGSLSAKEIYGFSKRSGTPTNYDDSGWEDWTTYVYNFYYDRSTFNIQFYYNDTLLKSTPKIRFGASIKSQEYEPARPEGVDEEYTFGGWYDNVEGAGDPYAFTTMPASNVKVYAKWIAPEKKVTLIYNNGTKNAVISVTKGETVELPTPEREGFTFTGWYTENNTLFDINQPITQDITITAGWKMNNLSYTVHYYKAGTTESVSANRTITSAAFTIGQEITENSVAVQGYRADAISKSINLQAGMNEIIFYYTQRAAVNYSVRYLELGTGSPLKDPETYSASQYTERVTVTAPDIAGYYPQQIVQSLLLTTNEAENVITFYYVAYGRTTFTVSYVDMEGNQLAEPVVVSRLIGDSFTADQKEFPDYTFDSIEGNDGKAYAVAKENGTVGITFRYKKCINVTFTGETASRSYNGKEQELKDITTTLPEGYKWSGLTYSAKGRDVGTYPGEFGGKLQITDANGKDVTKDFKVTCKPGKLTIEKAKLEITGESDTVEYTGSEQNVTGFKPEGLVSEAHEITGLTHEAKGTLVGEYIGEFSGEAKVMNGEEDVTGNYEITKTEGKLTITNREEKYEITVVANSKTETYDGTPKDVSGFETLTYTVDGNAYTVEGLTASAAGTNAGEYTSRVTGIAVVKDALGNDVTGQFTVKTENGTLTIGKREAEIKANDNLGIVYDGQPHGENGYTTSNLATGHSVSGITIDGEQTDVGYYTDELAPHDAKIVDAAGNDVSANYELTYESGAVSYTHLDVYKRQV